MLILTLFLFRLNGAFDWGTLFGDDDAEIITTTTETTTAATIGGRLGAFIKASTTPATTTIDFGFDGFDDEMTTPKTTTSTTTTTSGTTTEATTTATTARPNKTKCADSFGNFLNSHGDNVDCIEKIDITTTTSSTSSTSTSTTTTSTMTTSKEKDEEVEDRDYVYTEKRTDSSDSGFPVKMTTSATTTTSSTSETSTITTTTETTTVTAGMIGDIDGRETARTCAREGFKAIYGWCYTKFDKQPHGITARLAFKKCNQFGARFTLLGMARISDVDQAKIVAKLSERGEIDCGGMWTSAVSRPTYYNTAGSSVNSYVIVNGANATTHVDGNYVSDDVNACKANLPHYPQYNRYNYLDVFCFKVN